MNESSTDYDMEKAYRYLALQFKPYKNKSSQVTEVMCTIIEAKENLESTLRHNDGIREEERVRMDTMRVEERVRMTHNYIILFSDNKSDSGRG